MKRPPLLRAWRERLRSSRWRLWAALLLLVVSLLVVLVFLAAEYEESRDQTALEQDAAALGSDIRSSLVRNVQTLQSLHSVAPTADSWIGPAAELIAQHREMVRLEWLDSSQRMLAFRDSPFVPDLFGYLGRDQALPEVRLACDHAKRLSGPAYSSSYFWPLRSGKGLELIEMCLPVARGGLPSGFLVVTYSLPGMLSELTNRDLLRGRGLAFNEADGTRLALHSVVTGTRRTLTARHVLDLPGHTLLLQLQSPRLVRGLFPNVLTAVVGALSLALLSVLFLLARDIRRRQRAELDVAEALAFRKAMEDSLVTGLRARDLEGRITYVNPAFCQMVGLTSEQLTGKLAPMPYWPPEMVDEYKQRQAIRLAGNAPPREGFESVFMRADGTRFEVLIIEAPLISGQGQQTGWMGAVIDISEQRRIEELSRASQERLQATARLATVGEMASLLSHELNQPLAAISSYATGSINLLEAPTPAEQGTGAAAHAEQLQDVRMAMQHIARQAERAGKVIKSVHDFVRRRDQAREAVYAQQLLDAILPLVSLQARKLGVRVNTSLEPHLPPVLCDRTMVEQVLLNLARNAMQAMDDPALPTRILDIRVRRAASNQHSGWIEFAVTDLGSGIPPDVAERLFTPFFTTRPEGMGLGLSMCRTVIEQHGGFLGFAPHEPRGTVFTFTLPAATP